MNDKLIPVLASAVLLLSVLGLSVVITQTASATEIEWQIASITTQTAIPINADVNREITLITKHNDDVTVDVDFAQIDHIDLSPIETRNLHIISSLYVGLPRAIID